MTVALKKEQVFACSPETLFQLLEKDFKKQNKISKPLVEGMELKASHANITVAEYKENEKLSIDLQTTKECYTQTYTFLKEDGGVLMKYEEQYSTASFLRSLNFKLVRFLHRKRYKTKVEQMFQAIEMKLDEQK